MDVPAEIRLLGRVRAIFLEWAIAQQARVIENAFKEDLAQAKDWESRQVINAQRDFGASEHWNELRELRSRKLWKRALKLHLPLADIHWQDDQFANRFLEGESESKLYRAIREDKQKVWDFRLKIIAALTGLIGTAIGLIAILRR